MPHIRTLNIEQVSPKSSAIVYTGRERQPIIIIKSVICCCAIWMKTFLFPDGRFLRARDEPMKIQGQGRSNIIYLHRYRVIICDSINAMRSDQGQHQEENCKEGTFGLFTDLWLVLPQINHATLAQDFSGTFPCELMRDLQNSIKAADGAAASFRNSLSVFKAIVVLLFLGITPTSQPDFKISTYRIGKATTQKVASRFHRKSNSYLGVIFILFVKVVRGRWCFFSVLCC